MYCITAYFSNHIWFGCTAWCKVVYICAQIISEYYFVCLYSSLLLDSHRTLIFCNHVLKPGCDLYSNISIQKRVHTIKTVGSVYIIAILNSYNYRGQRKKFLAHCFLFLFVVLFLDFLLVFVLVLFSYLLLPTCRIIVCHDMWTTKRQAAVMYFSWFQYFDKIRIEKCIIRLMILNALTFSTLFMILIKQKNQLSILNLYWSQCAHKA